VNNVPRTRDSGGGVGLRLSNVAANNVFHISTPSGSNQRYWIRKIAVADLKAKNILIEVDGIDGEKYEAFLTL
jgi:hypothetical protein